MKRYYVRVGGDAVEVTVEGEPDGTLLASLGGATYRVSVAEVVPGRFSFVVDGRCHDLAVTGSPGVGAGVRRFALTIDGEPATADVGRSAWPGAGDRASTAARIDDVRAPMPGLLIALQVAEGADVAVGQPLIIMEAMKMQMEIRAPRAGRVRRFHVAPGQEIAGGQLLVTID